MIEAFEYFALIVIMLSAIIPVILGIVYHSKENKRLDKEHQK
jgi:hypothetical protein